MKRRWTRADVATALELDAAGQTEPQIGARLGRSPESIRHRLRYERAAPPPRPVVAHPAPKLPPPRRQPTAVWFGRCVAFRPRTDDDANRATRL